MKRTACSMKRAASRSSQTEPRGRPARPGYPSIILDDVPCLCLDIAGVIAEYCTHVALTRMQFEAPAPLRHDQPPATLDVAPGEAGTHHHRQILVLISELSGKPLAFLRVGDIVYFVSVVVLLTKRLYLIGGFSVVGHRGWIEHSVERTVVVDKASLYRPQLRVMPCGLLAVRLARSVLAFDVAETLVGATGGPIGVTEFEEADDGPEPAPFVATTLKV